VDAADLDEALDIAARIPAGKWGTVEVRPVIDVPSAPENFSSRPVDFAATQSTQ
jgi:hypothetical protein